MPRRTLTCLAVTLIAGVPLFAASPRERCSTRQPGIEEAAQMEKMLSRGHGRGQAEAVIPVWVHVITAGSGYEDGELPDRVIREQIRVLNDSYDGKTGGANTGFAFELAGITRIENEDWFVNMVADLDVELEAKAALRQGGPETLNIYTINGGPYTLGWAYFPTILFSSYPHLDGVAVDWRTLPGGVYEAYSDGDTATHEVGHWLALYHTFEGRCTKTNDYVGDTNAEFSPAFGCPVGRDSCSQPFNAGLDPIYNFMDYSDDPCMYLFTSGQADRMRSAWAAYRQ